MTKYLLNLVCIIGIAGAAHAGAVANLEITEDGHAYLVFFDGDGVPGTASNLAGYSIETKVGSTATLLRNPTPGTPEDGTGHYANFWSSLDAQGPVAGELEPGAGVPPDNIAEEDWFFDGIPQPTYFLGEGNLHGYMTRQIGAPIYIGRIMDPAAELSRDLADTDFGTGNWIDTNIEFKASDDPNNIVTVGDIGFRNTTTPLGTVSQDITGARWDETGPMGAADTDFDVIYVQNADGTGLKAVLDLKVASSTDDGTTFTSDLTGTVMIDGNVKQVDYADLVETIDGSGDITSSLLRVKVIDGDDMISIHANPIQSTDPLPAAFGKSAEGYWGTLASRMVVTTVPGDVGAVAGEVVPAPDDVCNDVDIDLMFAAVNGGSNNLLFDLNGDGVVNQTDNVADPGDVDLLVWTMVDTDLVPNGTQFGDSDLSGTVDFNDFSILAFWYNDPGGWAKGDYDGDGMVAFNDFSILAFYYGQGAPVLPGPPAPAGVPVPEPTTMTLLAIGGLALVRRRRRA